MIRGIGTFLVFLAMLGFAVWVTRAKRRPEFEEASMLPFADDPEALHALKQRQANRENAHGDTAP